MRGREVSIRDGTEGVKRRDGKGRSLDMVNVMYRDIRNLTGLFFSISRSWIFLKMCSVSFILVFILLRIKKI